MADRLRRNIEKASAVALTVAVGLGAAACSAEAPRVSASGTAVPGGETPSPSGSETEQRIDLTDLSSDNLWRMTPEQRLEAMRISKEVLDNPESFPQAFMDKVNAVWGMCASSESYNKMKAENGDPDVYKENVWKYQRPLIEELYGKDQPEIPDSQASTYNSCAVITSAQEWTKTQHYTGSFTPFSIKTTVDPSSVKVTKGGSTTSLSYSSTSITNVPKEDREAYDLYGIIPDKVFTSPKSVERRNEEVTIRSLKYDGKTVVPIGLKTVKSTTYPFSSIGSS